MQIYTNSMYPNRSTPRPLLTFTRARSGRLALKQKPEKQTEWATLLAPVAAEPNVQSENRSKLPVFVLHSWNMCPYSRFFETPISVNVDIERCLGTITWRPKEDTVSPIFQRRFIPSLISMKISTLKWLLIRQKNGRLRKLQCVYALFHTMVTNIILLFLRS